MGIIPTCRWCGDTAHSNDHCPRVVAFEFEYSEDEDTGKPIQLLSRVEFRSPEHDRILRDAATKIIAELVDKNI